MGDLEQWQEHQEHYSMIAISRLLDPGQFSLLHRIEYVAKQLDYMHPMLYPKQYPHQQ